ncbi:MAG TPA: helix-turn-helix domain-containing protein [Gemmatimonadaceae bacterium]|nr:helix-turn-helix domain-containing protein [Gemmatimonadaceae bacterium]
MKRTVRRSDCPINYALEMFGDGWSLLVIRDLMFTERRTYSDFLNAEEGMATNILASRLKKLQGDGLVRKTGTGRGARYALTPKGLDLLPAMLELIAWSGKHDRFTGAPKGFLTRIQKDRGRVMAEFRSRLSQEYEIGNR